MIELMFCNSKKYVHRTHNLITLNLTFSTYLTLTNHKKEKKIQ